MKAYLSSISLPGAPDILENPLPRFRDMDNDREIGSDGSFLPEHFENLGKNTAFRVLPYKMQDNYRRGRETCPIKTAVLENDILAATFLPGFGGRLYSLYNKRDKRELLFCNPVIQPANIAIRDAWLSGGIEWNIGRTGHTYHTSAPVFFQKCVDINGAEFLRMYEYDRCEGLCFSIEFRLPEGSAALFASVKITNPRAETVPMYWWTNTAVRETADMRVLSASDKVLFHNTRQGGAFGYGQMPYLDSVPGKDSSFPVIYDRANEYFFQVPEGVGYPWEAAVYPAEGWLFAEYSTSMLRYRKMFTWGRHRGAQKWKDLLSDPGKGDYIEIQAGLAPTQVHGLFMPAGATWGFTQAFTSVNTDAEAICKMDYQTAAAHTAGLLERRIPEFPPEDKGGAEFISCGSGWGALEAYRRKINGLAPLPLSFPEASIGADELSWLNLLANGRLPENTASFMIDMPGSGWRGLLEKDGGKEALVHLGVMYYENGMDEKAAEAWKKSLPHALAYRNLSLIEIKNGNSGEAIKLMEQAAQSDGSYPYKKEYADLLIKAGDFGKCWGLLAGLSGDAPDRLWIYRAQCAWETGRYTELEAMFAREYSCIREGETVLTDLWFKWAEKTNQANKTDPPPHIDFRMS